MLGGVLRLAGPVGAGRPRIVLSGERVRNQAGEGHRGIAIAGADRDLGDDHTCSIRIATGGAATTGFEPSCSSASSTWVRAHLWVTKITGAVGSR